MVNLVLLLANVAVLIFPLVPYFRTKTPYTKQGGWGKTNLRKALN